jgi:hypothetical protein
VSGIAWSGHRWVIVVNKTIDYANTILWSTDGINWNSANNSLNTGVNSVTWNGSLFVAVGEGTDGVITSSDGETWIESTSGNSVLGTICNSICSRIPLPLTYINRQVTSKFCVGAVGSILIYSYDGLQWHRSPSTPFTSGVKALVWNGLIWVAGAYYANSTPTLAYSFDGIIWTASTSGTDLLNQHVRSVAWGGNVWVAVGQGTTCSLAYSYDGINWIRSDTAYSIEQTLETVAWNGTMWLAGANKLMRSYDGITWTMILSSFPTQNGGINKLATNGRIWLFGASSNSPTPSAYNLAYSTDGVNWTQTNIDNILGNAQYGIGIIDFAWNGSRWVASCYADKTLIYSLDGITWTASTNQTGGGFSITWNGSIFISGGNENINAPISTDGDYWSSGSLLNIYSVLPAGTPTNQSVIIKSRIPLPYITSYTDNTIEVINRQVTSKFCVAGQGTTFAYSYDGVVWYKSPSVSISGNIRSIAFNGSMWVAVTDNGGSTNSMAYSYNGINWILTSSGSAILNGSIYNVAWGGNIWIAVGHSNPYNRGLIYSYDGINWTLSTSANQISIQYECVAWNGTMWLAATNNNKLAYSSDGINWAVAVTTPDAVLAIATNGRMWVWATQNGNISYSYDGFDWISSATIQDATYAYTILWNGSAWLITSETLTNPIMYSINGTTWNPVSSPFTNTNYTRGITWNGSVWLVGGDGTTAGCAISTDGTNWARCTTLETILPTGNIYFASRNVLPINPISSGSLSYFPSTSITWASSVPKTLNAGIDTLAVNISSINTTLSSISVTRYLYGSGTTSSGSLTVTFSSAFANAPNVTATISGNTAGFIIISTITTTAFTVKTYNTSGTLANYTFNWHAVL